MATQIRPYRECDWKLVCLVYDLAKPDELRGLIDGSAILPLDMDEKMKELFKASIVYVAEKASHVIGFVGLRENFITWLFVHPDHRREGVAGDLLRQVLQSVHGAVTLNVAKRNEPAMRFYERFGFHIEWEFAGNFNEQEVQVAKLRLVV